MKKATILTTVLFLASFAFTTQGYAQDSGQMTVSAEVLRTVNITNVTDLNFGEVLPDVDKDHTDAGLFTITGAAGYDIDLSWNQGPADLQFNSSTLAISWDIKYGNDNGSLAGTWESPWAVLTSETLSGTIAVGGDGNFYVEVGGTVEPLDDQAAGSYEVELDLNVVYSETQSYSDPG